MSGSERKLIEEARRNVSQYALGLVGVEFIAALANALETVTAERAEARVALEAALAREQRKDEAIRHVLRHGLVGKRSRRWLTTALAAVPVETQEAAEAVVVDSVNDRYAVEHPHGNWRVATPEERAQEAAEPDDYSRPGWRMFPVM